MARLSGLQREVLKLYRACIRTVKTKPVDSREHWRSYIREEFEKHRELPKKSFNVIEHLIRTGHRKFEMYSNPQIKDIH
ncbi:complex 1 protein-domain-containing protein [Scheffersomyces xylosifermentans]|uniref:complex 1 protein-domain-containing protein n=1 Tax=Scheffersomyces xylosifermentans TaxID=1304137 RepID=UPI00315CA34B